MQNIFLCDYEQLVAIKQQFSVSEQEISSIQQSIQQVYQPLAAGDWQGQGAVQFIHEMEHSIFPAFQRLAMALEQAARTTNQVSSLIRVAETEASQLFNGNASTGLMSGISDPGGYSDGSHFGGPAEQYLAFNSQATQFQEEDSTGNAFHDDLINAANATTVDPGVDEWSFDDIVRWKTPLIGDPNYVFEFKEQWVHGYRDTILAAAQKYNIPVELLAGVAFNEVGGDPLWIDDVAYQVRKFDHLGDPFFEPLTITTRPELTSFGNMSLQVRRAAETLGYDPQHLTSAQESAIIDSLKDPRQSIFIAAAHLDQLRNIDYRGVNASDLTAEDIRIIATRYNRGPDLTIDQIRQNTWYGDAVVGRIDKLRELVQ